MLSLFFSKSNGMEWNHIMYILHSKFYLSCFFFLVLSLNCIASHCIRFLFKILVTGFCQTIILDTPSIYKCWCVLSVSQSIASLLFLLFLLLLSHRTSIQKKYPISLNLNILSIHPSIHSLILITSFLQTKLLMIIITRLMPGWL